MKLGLAGLSAILLSGCAVGMQPVPLPDRLPDYRSTAGNRVLAEDTVGQFEVIGQPGDGPAQYWCAAGEYAANRLGQFGARLYVARPLGPSQMMPGRPSVTFTLRPASEVLEASRHLPGDDLSMGIRRIGHNFSASAAEAACDDQILLPWDI